MRFVPCATNVAGPDCGIPHILEPRLEGLWTNDIIAAPCPSQAIIHRIVIT